MVREELEHFLNDILEESNRLRLHVENVMAHSPGGADLHCSSISQLRIGGDGGLHVAGHTNLRDHCDSELPRVEDDPPHVSQRIEPAVRLVVENEPASSVFPEGQRAHL